MTTERPRSSWVEEQTARILKERTPSPDQVIYEPTIEFLDPEGRLIREERGKVIAMGDRTAIAYKELARRVIEERGKPPVELEGELVDATTAFYLQYALAARSQNEISHTSILEQMNVGPEEFAGDPPIILEGVSVLAGLRDVASLRHFGFEAFSSRGGIFPEGYWRIPQELVDAGIGNELEAINREVYRIYLELTEAGIKHYLQTLQKREGEKDWQFRWRVLNSALDDSRQVTNQTFLNHVSMHPNSALSMREGIVKLASSELPETVEIANRLRELARQGLPSLMRFTDSSQYQQGLPEKRRAIGRELGLGKQDLYETTILRSRLYRSADHEPAVDVGDNPEREFLLAFITNGLTSHYSFLESRLKAISKLSNEEIERLIDEIFDGIGFHDKPPQELEFIQVCASFDLSVGAIYELVRHRLATHLLAGFTPYHGFTMPQIYDDLGLKQEYLEAMSLNGRAYHLVAKFGGSRWEDVFGPYFVARAHLQPATVRMSGLDAFHILRIRADPGAHPDIRDPMMELEGVLREKHPAIFKHLVKRNR